MEDNIPNGIPPFDGSNFEYWSNIMKTYFKYLGEYVWFSVASGLLGPNNSPYIFTKFKGPLLKS
jgi:hypothetical protein